MMLSPVAAVGRRHFHLKELTSFLAKWDRYASRCSTKQIQIPQIASFLHTYSCMRRLHMSSRADQKDIVSSNNKSGGVQQRGAGGSVQTQDSGGGGEVVPSQGHKGLQEHKSILPDYEKDRHGFVPITLEQKALDMFDEASAVRGENKEGFLYAVSIYIARQKLYRQGATEFIYVGMKKMKEWGLLEDLGTYKALIQAFPVDKMVPTSMLQVEMNHYPKQNWCAIDLQEQMQKEGVIPDDEFGDLLKKRFGKEGQAVRKYRRMLYWMPKLKHTNPWPIPDKLPESPDQLALIALKRMCVDRETEYKVWMNSEEDADTQEDTFIASAQSPTQRELIKKHSPEQPLFVEGPFPVFLKKKKLDYFMLRAEPNINDLMKMKQWENENNDDDNLFEWKTMFEEEEPSALRPMLSVHEQEDCTVLALVITGTGCKSSLVRWVRQLERTNPNLAHTPVLFKIFSESDNLDVIGDNRKWRKTAATVPTVKRIGGWK